MAFRTNKMPVLQEKSVSGSVATFNTALAMPLSSCNIAVNAWQEGSGDPSPYNVRPIHGFSEVNATRAGKNLLPPILNNEQQSIYANGVTLTVNNGKFHIEGLATNSGGRATLRTKNFLLPKGTYYISTDRVGSAIFLQDTSTIIKSGNGTFTLTENTEVYVGFNVFNGTDYNETFYVQLEVGSTPTSYEPYVTPTIYTKSLGEDVYGGSYNSVSGVKRKTWECKKIKDLSNFSYVAPSAAYPYGFISMAATGKKPNLTNVKCDCFKTTSGFSNNNAIMGTSSNIIIYVVTDTISSKEEFLSTYGDYMVMFELLTPIETDIGATPISTLIGNNTIFADTGDIDLTYKDLDIAKRGNFREVFKLPS